MVQEVEDQRVQHDQRDVADGPTMPAGLMGAAIEVAGTVPKADGGLLGQRDEADRRGGALCWQTSSLANMASSSRTAEFGSGLWERLCAATAATRASRIQALENVTGLSGPFIQRVLRALLAAGIIAKEETGHGKYANRYRLLLTAGSGA
jgi:hypothetical protein